jgi:deazaflavin-dependent oxidoreductase (nitroreductase family)
VTTADEQRLLAEFRATGGRVSGAWVGTPVLLLHHVGRRSGTRRVTPLAYSCHSRGRLVVVATNGGAATHPAWLHNLRARPDVAIEVGAETITVQASEADGREREELWAEIVQQYPDVGRFASQTRRTITLVVLEQRSPALHR